MLLVHGAWHGAWCWRHDFGAFFADHGFKVHMIDLRGHGDSEPQKAMRWNRISDYVDDVEKVVRNLDRPPVVIGHSMGGFIVQHLLRRNVDLNRVGLLATVPSFGVWKTVLNFIRSRPIDFLKANLTLSLYPLVKDREKAADMFLDSTASQTEKADFHSKLIDESYLAFLDMLFLNLPKPAKQGFPMLVVGGERDNIFAPDTQQWTARRYECACHIISDAPHDLMLSKHWEVAAELFLDWMEGN